MKTFLVKVRIEAETEEQAEILRAEMVGALEDATESGDIPFPFSHTVGDLTELNTDRINKVRDLARDQHGSDEIEIDEDATLSEGEDGPWIQGWLFVSKDDLGDGTGDEEPQDQSNEESTKKAPNE